MLEQNLLVAEIDSDTEANLETEMHALDAMLQPLAASPVAPRNPGFQFPRSIWMGMLSCYAVFFAAIAMATGGSLAARFAIVVSVLYTVVFFGVSRIGARQGGPEASSPLNQGKMLDTWTGPMDRTAVYGQVLIVPIALALFAISILAITLVVG